MFGNFITMHSHTEENYLKAIYKLLEKSNNAVTTNAIAEKLKTRAASVTDMLGKLSRKNLIHYKKYQGVTLTESGKKIALTIIRKHRLWEMFLVEKLNFRWDEVHEIAEQLEHIQSDKLIRQVDKFLNFPKYDPHGDPIPDERGRLSGKKSYLLSDLKKNESVIMAGVVDHSDQFLRYLDSLGISLGNEIKIKEIQDYDRSLYINTGTKKNLYVSNDVARNILVRKKIIE